MSSSLWNVEPVKPQLFFSGSTPPEPPSILNFVEYVIRVTDLPPRQPDFDYSSFKIGDVVLVDRTEIGDGLRKATIVYVNKEYSPDYEYFHGHLVVLKPSARERSRNCKGKRTVYYVHYAGLDRRMDEWIDVHEIHSAVESANAPSFSQLGSTLLLSDLNDPPTKKTRSQKKKAEEFQHNEKASIDYGATLARCEENHEKATMLKNVDSIQIGPNVVRCWYFSPYPADVITGRHLYICENCLMYFSSRPFFQMHLSRCAPSPPPGELIYFDKDNRFAVYEVIGAENRFYCESLCLLSKLFLDHKTLYYQVDTFYFYVLCEIEDDGTHHLVGHFSKENYSMNNLACILVLPPYQRKGYGKFLIQLSYAFSCREGFIGTPEKPLSDLGKVSYRGFWWWLLINYIDEGGYEDDINVLELERITGVSADDIISTFEPMEFVKKYKGEMCISMSPTILKFCKSLPLFTGPKLLIDCDLIKWTERYLPVVEDSSVIVREEVVQEEMIKKEKEEIEAIPDAAETSQTLKEAEVQDVDMEAQQDNAVEIEENNLDYEDFEDEDDEYEDVDDDDDDIDAMNDDDEFVESSINSEEEEPDIDEDENIDDLCD
uniref:Histone acetyltransferase n=1 Tax=Panagrolaimus superbus TaxID=310955 RepID=A0A914YK17_9BILA